MTLYITSHLLRTSQDIQGITKKYYYLYGRKDNAQIPL